MDSEMNRLRRLLDEVKGKYSDALKEIKQLKAVNRELSGCLGWHIEAVGRYEKALKAYGDEEGKLILKDLREMEKFLKNQEVKGHLTNEKLPLSPERD